MTRKIKSTKTAEQREAELAQLYGTVSEQVEQLRDSDAWTRFLRYARSFHSYSLNNLLLILTQKPTATQVAGYRTWQELGRQVRSGEGGPNAIRIIGGREKTRKVEDEETGEEKRVRWMEYFPCSVFDIAQTEPIEGAEQPPELAQQLDGQDENGIYDAVADFVTAQGWTITRELIPGETNGYTTTDGSKRIAVDSDLSPAQSAKTALHEAAHMLLHANENDTERIGHRGIKEIEAESVAYVVAGILGLDTTAYSIGYIAGWSKCDTETIKTTATNVLNTARRIADAITAAEEDTAAA